MSPQEETLTTEELAGEPSETEALEMEEPKEKGFLQGLLTPVGFFMFGIAAFVDVVEVILDVVSIFTAGIPEIVSIILDVFALLTIGLWMVMRSGEAKVPKKAAVRIGKAAKWAKRAKWLRPLLVGIELIPYVGMVPCWMVAVYLELKHS